MHSDWFTTRWCAQSTHSRSLLLMVALLPALTFLGHWPALRVAIPGTELYVAVPLFGHDGQSVEADSHARTEGHGQHCHENASSCSDVPYAGANSFDLMGTAVAALGSNAVSIRMFVTTAAAPAGTTVSPELRPPKRQL